MLLLRGATYIRNGGTLTYDVSIHAPLARSNGMMRQWLDDQKFQYMLLLRGATSPVEDALHIRTVSIHAPLARSNFNLALYASALRSFNTCSSCEEQLSTPAVRRHISVSIHAPLARSNIQPLELRLLYYWVSIHAPLARSNHVHFLCGLKVEVSIHAPLARSNSRP